MKILIAMESSGIIRDAFLKAGHDAISCDLLPTEKDGPHYQGDVYDILFSENLDMIIAHPTCTKLCVSGNHVYAKGKPKYSERIESVEWTVKFWEDCKKVTDKVCFENPIGVSRSMGGLPKPQIVQPYQFGHDASKATCLFLHNLPNLVQTKRIHGRIVIDPKTGKQVERWSNQTDSGQNKLGPSDDRWKERSRTYSGIADAMVMKWS